MKYQIGEFSRITQLSVKALRHYHKLNILVPQEIDEWTKYRYYTEPQIEKARAIKILKKMDFSLLEISRILKDCDEDADIIQHLSVKAGEIQEIISKYRKVQKEIDRIINQKTMNSTNNLSNKIEIKKVEDLNMVSIRYLGKYPEIGKYFGKLYKACWGKVDRSKYPFALYYDDDYKEENADIEACLPVKDEVKMAGIEYRQLKGGQAYCLIHKGPYETIGESYKKILDRIKVDKAEIESPSRELYLKGPGIIFKGNPENYLTEIQIIKK